MKKTENLIAQIANKKAAREEFREAWRIDKCGIRAAVLERLETDGLLVITPVGGGEAHLHFTNTEEPGVKMVMALIDGDAEIIWEQ
jgi:hypothetical protein